MVDAEAPVVVDPLPGVHAERQALDAVLARMRVLALARFSKQRDALQAFFEEAARLARDAWPEITPEGPESIADEDEDEDEDDAEPEEAPVPAEAMAALLAHLDQLEELMEALSKQ